METQTRNITVLNRSTVKKYALAVSETRRAGKFTRVGEEFFLRCEANLESAIRGLAGPDSDAPPVAPGFTFITRTSREKVEEKLEALAKRIIFLEVLRHPSLGCTLK